MAIPTTSTAGPNGQGSTQRSAEGDRRHRREVREAAARALPAADQQEQEVDGGRGGGRARAPRVHLGHRTDRTSLNRKHCATAPSAEGPAFERRTLDTGYY